MTPVCSTSSRASSTRSFDGDADEGDVVAGGLVDRLERRHLPTHGAHVEAKKFTTTGRPA